LKIHVDKYHTNSNLPTSSTFSSIVSITKLLINLKHQLPTIRRLRKACRHLAADKLSSIINNCLSNRSISSFENILLFSYRAFNVAEKSLEDVAEELKKNPSPSRQIFFPDAFKPGDFSLIVNEQNVQEANQFLSCRFFTVLRWHEITILQRYYNISLSAGEAGQRALRALTKLQFFIVWPTFFRNLSFIIWCVFMRPS
jgi:hypothetical protein